MSQISRSPLQPAPSAVFPYRLNKSIFDLHNQNLPGTNVIVSEKGKLAYVPIPKNACSSLKLFFFKLINGAEFAGVFNEIHGKFKYAASDFEKFAEDRSYYKFVVVRDPLERFVSAYNNRVKMYRELSKGWFTANYPNHDKFLKEFDKRLISFDPAIGEFARRIEDYIELNPTIRHHFIPQHNFFYGRPEVFDRIYNIRQLPELARDIEARIEQPVSFRNVQETKNLRNPALLSDLNESDLTHIKDFYRQDYHLLAPYL